MNFTAEQLRAIEERGRQVFVSAGAGTGKTALMVERYVRYLLEDHLTPDALPTVTFTRKAAAELRSRVRYRLLREGRPDLAWALDGAPIDTIHGLCSRVLRAHAVLAGIDPGYGVVDEHQGAILRRRVARDVWGARVTRGDAGELTLLAVHKRRLIEGVPGLYERLRGLGWNEPRFLVEGGTGVEAAGAALEEALQGALAMRDRCGSGKVNAANLDKTAACLDWLCGADNPGGVDALDSSTRFWPHLNCGAAMKPVFTGVRDALSVYRAALAEAVLLPLASLVDRMLQDFHSRYRKEKEVRGLLDFADLELGCRGLLRGGVKPFGPGSHLMVDEFQDTNPVQSEILGLLGTETIFTVGDEYQSIYGFRGADLDVFRGWRKRVSTLGGLVWSVGENFRTRSPVLDVIGRAFASDALFGSAFSPLRAGRDGDDPRPGHGMLCGVLKPAVQVMVLTTADTKKDGARTGEREAALVADRVAALVSHDGWRQRDIVILLRALTHVDRFEGALLSRGLTPYVVGGRGYYTHEEVTDMRALLRVLVNPRDDLALATVLRSPLVGVSDDCLFVLGRQTRARGDGGLWPLLLSSRQARVGPGDQARLHGFVVKVEGLRRRVGRPGMAALVEEAVNAFDYDLVVLRGPGGRRRLANLRKLMTLAEEFETVSGPDLAGLLDYLDDLGDLQVNEGSAAVLGEEGDVVRVMSIHQAKGLEFPVVVVAALGSRNNSGHGEVFFAGRDGKLGLTLSGVELKGDERPFCLGAVREMEREEESREAEERRRVLYVGVTRAEERVLVALCVSPDPGRWLDTTAGQLLVSLGVKSLPEGEVRPMDGLDLRVVSAALVEPAAIRGTPAVTEPPVPAPAPPPFPMTRASPVIDRAASFSSLAASQRCPRGYYLEHVLGLSLDDVDAREHSPGEGGPGGREIGLLVHRVLERVDLARRPEADDLALLARAAARDLDIGPSGPAMERALELVGAFWRSPVATEPRLAAARKECSFMFAQGEILVSGVIDLLIADERCWHVVDYKTNRLDGRDAEEVLSGYRLQAEVYALAGLMQGAPFVTVSFLLLDAPEILHSRRYASDDRSGLEAHLGSVLGMVGGAGFPEKRDGCVKCEFATLCATLVEGAEDGLPEDLDR